MSSTAPEAPGATPPSKRARSEHPQVAAKRGKRPSAHLARAGEVLELLRRGDAVTTTELAESLGVVRSTITERVQTLMHHNLVVNAGETSSSRGRPAGILAFNAEAGTTLVAQVGMSGSFVAITNLRAEILWHRQRDLDVATEPSAIFELLDTEFRAGLKELDLEDRPIYGIGVGLPGDLEIALAKAAGRTTTDSTAEHDLAVQLEEAFDCKVFLDRDVNFMALGEHRTSWPDSRVLLCLKVGTVIASGLVIDGRVLHGATGMSGEIGHSKVKNCDTPCACGSRGCLNTVAGGVALAERLTTQGIEAHSARDLALLANQGVPEAGQVVREAGRLIGAVVADAINLLNPDVISVWGYLADTGDQFLAGMHEAIYSGALPSAATAVALQRSRLGDDAGIKGAALTVIERTLTAESVNALISG